MKAKPWSYLLVAIAGWIHRKQQDAMDYLREENRILLEQLGRSRLRLTDGQRWRLAQKGKGLALDQIRSHYGKQVRNYRPMSGGLLPRRGRDPTLFPMEIPS